MNLQKFGCETGEQIANLLFDLVRDTQMTLLMVTHNRDLAARCQRQVVLQRSNSLNFEPTSCREQGID